MSIQEQTNKEKIIFFIEKDLYIAALLAAQEYYKECGWLLDAQVHQNHTEYERWMIAVKDQLQIIKKDLSKTV